MATKYIRNQSRFIVFHENCQHRDMAIKAFGPDKLIHGAGFTRLALVDGHIKAECYGESISLDVEPRRDDHEHMLLSIGVENPDVDDIEHAKYVIWRGNAVVFSNNLEHKTVAEAAFMGSIDCESAGFVKFLVHHKTGKIKIQCYGESMSLGASSNKEDYKVLAELMRLSPDTLHDSE